MKYAVTVHILQCEIDRVGEEIVRLTHYKKRLTTSINALKKVSSDNTEGIQAYQEDVDEREIVIEEWVEWRKELITELEVIKKLQKDDQ